MIDSIDEMIKNCSYSRDDVEDATCGLCGTFALSLYRFLKKRNINCEIVAFCEEPGPHNRYSRDKSTQWLWSHFAVEANGNIYDIRGKVNPEDVIKEFNTPLIIPHTEKELLDELRILNKQGHVHYSFKKYQDYKNKLSTMNEMRIKMNIVSSLF
jgi:hypothetical protein